MKTCTKCGIDKEFAEFAKRKSSKDGLHTWCKVCKSAYHRDYASKNPDKMDAMYSRQRERHKETRAEYNKRYRDKNSDKVSAYNKQYYAENKDHYKGLNKNWYEANKEAVSLKARKRYQHLSSNAMPSWLGTMHKSLMRAIYDDAKMRTSLTGELHHVDHIIPLRGDGVCGLHVPWNLQVLPAHMNDAKGNRYHGGW